MANGLLSQTTVYESPLVPSYSQLGPHADHYNHHTLGQPTYRIYFVKLAPKLRIFGHLEGDCWFVWKMDQFMLILHASINPQLDVYTKRLQLPFRLSSTV